MSIIQAFLEMADESAASAMVNCYAGCMAQLRGRAVYVQFSNHRELKTDQTHSNAVSIYKKFISIVTTLIYKLYSRAKQRK